MEHALQVLPISMLNGLSLLTNSSASFYGSIAFMWMIAVNVPIVTLGLEQIKGKLLTVCLEGVHSLGVLSRTLESEHVPSGTQISRLLLSTSSGKPHTSPQRSLSFSHLFSCVELFFPKRACIDMCMRLQRRSNFALFLFVGLVCVGSMCSIEGLVHGSLSAFILAALSALL